MYICNSGTFGAFEPDQEKWEVLLGIRLLGTTFWRGLSSHQAATAQNALGGKRYRRVPTPLRSTSPFSCISSLLSLLLLLLYL